MTTEQKLRDCICADPENCTQAVPGYRCRKSRSSQPPTSDEGTPITDAAKFVAINTGSTDDQEVVDAEISAELERTLHAKERELAALSGYVQVQVETQKRAKDAEWRLRESMENYGLQHTGICNMNHKFTSKTCNCGLSNAYYLCKELAAAPQGGKKEDGQ